MSSMHITPASGRVRRNKEESRTCVAHIP